MESAWRPAWGGSCAAGVVPGGDGATADSAGTCEARFVRQGARLASGRVCRAPCEAGDRCGNRLAISRVPEVPSFQFAEPGRNNRQATFGVRPRLLDCALADPCQSSGTDVCSFFEGFRWVSPVSDHSPRSDPDRTRTRAEPTLPSSRPGARGSLRVKAPSLGDRTGWNRLMARWDVVGDDLIRALLSPFPPLWAGMRLASRIGATGLLELGRSGISPVRRLAGGLFRGEVELCSRRATPSC